MFLDYSSSQNKLPLQPHRLQNTRNFVRRRVAEHLQQLPQTTEKKLTAIINIKEECDGQQKISYTRAEDTKQCQVHYIFEHTVHCSTNK